MRQYMEHYHTLKWFFAFLLVKSLHQLTRVNPVSYPLALCITSVNNSRIHSSKHVLVLRVHALCTVTHIARL